MLPNPSAKFLFELIIYPNDILCMYLCMYVCNKRIHIWRKRNWKCTNKTRNGELSECAPMNFVLENPTPLLLQRIFFLRCILQRKYVIVYTAPKAGQEMAWGFEKIVHRSTTPPPSRAGAQLYIVFETRIFLTKKKVSCVVSQSCEAKRMSIDETISLSHKSTSSNVKLIGAIWTEFEERGKESGGI